MDACAHPVSLREAVWPQTAAQVRGSGESPTAAYAAVRMPTASPRACAAAGILTDAAGPDEAALGASRPALGPVPTASPVALRLHAGPRLLSVAPLPRTSLRLVIRATPAGPTTAGPSAAPRPAQSLLRASSHPAA